MKTSDWVVFGIAVLWCGLMSASAYKVGNIQGLKEGTKQGVDMYHKLCYTGEPPTLVFADDGTVVLCGPLTQIPEEEVKKIKPTT